MKFVFSVMVLFFSASLQAEPTNLEQLSFKTQHDAPVKLHAGLRTILFAHDMKSKDIVDDAIGEKPEGYLQRYHSAFVANISGMPRIIARMFAYPSMRKEHYEIWLDEAGDQTTDWDQAEDTVTVYSVNNFEITQVEFVQSPEKLIEMIEASHEQQRSEPAASPQINIDPNGATEASSDTNQQ